MTTHYAVGSAAAAKIGMHFERIKELEMSKKRKAEEPADSAA
jgi:hypothetical protein